MAELGFLPESYIQEWRHFIAFGKYKGVDSVFKMASTKKTGEKTMNEFNWNDAVHTTPASHKAHFTVPKNYLSGNFNGLFYFIAQRFTGDPLINMHSPTNLANITNKIDLISKAFLEISSLPISPDCAFAKSKKSKLHNKPLPGIGLFRSSCEWASQIPKNLDSFLKVVDNSKETIGTSVGHGDPTPRHMFSCNRKIGLIDGEHAGLAGPKYYDAAYFYIRLRNDHFAEALAGEFLLQFRQLLPKDAQSTFWEEIKPVLIQRYIGDLWGSATNPRKLSELESLGQQILLDRIIPDAQLPDCQM